MKLQNRLMTREQLEAVLEGRYFKNANGRELAIQEGGYNTFSGFVRLSDLPMGTLRALYEFSYRKETQE